MKKITLPDLLCNPLLEYKSLLLNTLDRYNSQLLEINKERKKKKKQIKYLKKRLDANDTGVSLID